MSVTFTTEGLQETESELPCYCVDKHGPYLTCPDCKGTGVMKFKDYPDEVTLANSNACLILRILNYDNQELMGEASGPEFLKVCAKAIDLGFDGLQAFERVTREVGPITYCGANPAYLVSTLQRLMKLGKKAGDKPVRWS